MDVKRAKRGKSVATGSVWSGLNHFAPISAVRDSREGTEGVGVEEEAGDTDEEEEERLRGDDVRVKRLLREDGECDRFPPLVGLSCVPLPPCIRLDFSD